MLDLVARIGREFGISIMMSSRLWQRSSASATISSLSRAELVQSGSISAFTGRIGSLTVEVDGSAAALAAYLEDAAAPTARVSTYSKSTSRTTARTT